MNRRKLGAVTALTVALAACTTASTTTEVETTSTTVGSTTSAAAAEPFRVAIVAPSASNDLAFTQSIVDAVETFDDLDVAITDNTFVVEDAAAAIRDYAEQGYDLVIAHGSQYGASVEEIAPDYSDVAFAWGTAADTFDLPNVFAYEAASDEGGYVLGAVAAAMSESGILGVVGPIEVGDAKLYVDGFRNGALAENPDVTVNVNYIGSFSDVALASEAASSLLSAGADVLTGTAQMTVGAIGVAAENGVAWFGTQSNQTSVAPEVVVASQVYHWEVVLSEIIDSVRAGTLGGEIFTIDLANGGLVIEYNDGSEVPDDVRSLADEIVDGIVDGSITTGA